MGKIVSRWTPNYQLPEEPPPPDLPPEDDDERDEDEEEDELNPPELEEPDRKVTLFPKTVKDGLMEFFTRSIFFRARVSEKKSKTAESITALAMRTATAPMIFMTIEIPTSSKTTGKSVMKIPGLIKRNVLMPIPKPLETPKKCQKTLVFFF